jgi:hypothetical protein
VVVYHVLIRDVTVFLSGAAGGASGVCSAAASSAHALTSKVVAMDLRMTCSRRMGAAAARRFSCMLRWADVEAWQT